MGGDDEAVALEADVQRDAIAEGGVGWVVSSVRVVEFYEFVEADFGVSCAADVVEDLVRRWLSVRMERMRPLIDEGFINSRLFHGSISSLS